MVTTMLKKILTTISLIIISIITIISIAIFNYNNDNTLYDKNSVKAFKENNIYEYVKSYEYSKTLDNIINTSYFNVDYIDYYINIDYINDDTFLENISALLLLGYTDTDINIFYENFDNDAISIIINNKYDSDIINYLSLPYFNIDNLDRYIKFKHNEDKLSYSIFINEVNIDNLTYEDIVTYTNIGLDYEYYANDYFINNDESNNINVLVNKYNKLPESYFPSDLVDINLKYSVSGQKLRHEATNNFEKMCESALNDGIKIYAGSAYRSYDYQKNLYEKYVLSDGINIADTYSARPGYSEHQLGLAVDILNGKWTYINEDDIEYEWLINNSYKYGFILRYPMDKEIITGYIYETWHFRYIGVDNATSVYNSKLTYDEYINRQDK